MATETHYLIQVERGVPLYWQTVAFRTDLETACFEARRVLNQWGGSHKVRIVAEPGHAA
jgi:hypothetical protein